MIREDYYERMHDLFVTLYKNVRFSRPGWSIELDEKNVTIVIKYTMGDKMYVATVRTKMYEAGMSFNVFRHEKNGTEVHLYSHCLASANCNFDRFIEEADIIAERIENDMLTCFNRRVLYPAINNMKASYWEMTHWGEVARSFTREDDEELND